MQPPGAAPFTSQLWCGGGCAMGPGAGNRYPIWRRAGGGGPARRRTGGDGSGRRVEPGVCSILHATVAGGTAARTSSSTWRAGPKTTNPTSWEEAAPARCPSRLCVAIPTPGRFADPIRPMGCTCGATSRAPATGCFHRWRRCREQMAADVTDFTTETAGSSSAGPFLYKQDNFS